MRAAMMGALVLSVGWGSAQAMQLDIDRPTLCAHATAAIIGEVTTRQSQWSQGSLGGIETVFDVSVERVVFGAAPGDLSVVVPGGQIGDIHLNVEDAAPLQVDQRYLLLVKVADDGRRYIVFGGEQGATLLPHQPQLEAEAIASLGSCDAP
ncbi:MAG: hypothetical protein AAFV53_03160 [Myxococcota bacterium]